MSLELALDFAGLFFVALGLHEGWKLWQYGPRYSFDDTVPLIRRWSFVNKWSFLKHLVVVFFIVIFLLGIFSVIFFYTFLNSTLKLSDVSTMSAAVFVFLSSSYVFLVIQLVVVEWTLYGYVLGAVVSAAKLLNAKNKK